MREAANRYHSSNRYHSYIRGWKDGACSLAKRRKFVEHATLAADYRQGYADGNAARSMASRAATEFTGYAPTILRAVDEDSP